MTKLPRNVFHTFDNCTCTKKFVLFIAKFFSFLEEVHGNFFVVYLPHQLIQVGRNLCGYFVYV